MEDLSGVNIQEIQSIIDNLNNSASILSDIFEQMKNIINCIDTCIGEEMGAAIKQSFHKFDSSFSNSLQIINVYVKELNALHGNFKIQNENVESILLSKKVDY